MTRSGFDQTGYWIDRHRKLRDDPRSVGNLGVQRAASEAGEAALKTTVAVIAKMLKQSGQTVLDLGCGYGRVASAFIDAGWAYTGIDVSPDAIERAKREVPGGFFEQADLAQWQPTRAFDLVMVLYVFVHFVNDARWLSFVERALSAVGPQGALLMADHFPSERQHSVQHVVGRPLSAYEPILERHGFLLDGGFRDRLRELAGAGNRDARQFYLARRRS